MPKELFKFPLDERGCVFYYCFKNSRVDREDPRPYFLSHLPQNQITPLYKYQVTWVDPVPFEDTMQIERTYEEKTLVKSASTGFYYAIFPSDLCTILLQNTIDHGKITGTWQYVRHGNIGIKLTGV